MNEFHQRALLYGGAVLLLAGLGTARLFGSRDADVTTLLSGADVQLRLAHAIPAKDQQGQALSSREDMLATAERFLADVERIRPGMAVTAEFRGFAHMLRGQFQQAAECYRQARGCGDCQAEQRDILAFNEARMWAEAGQRQRALAVFAEHGKALDVRWPAQRAIEEASLLRQLGRRDEAVARLETIRRDREAVPMASLQAGLEFVELGCDDQAAELFVRTAPVLPIADYHLARLKLQRGEVDMAMELLGRVATVRPAEVRQRLSQDAEAWSAAAGDARFQELRGSQPAAPMR